MHLLANLANGCGPFMKSCKTHLVSANIPQRYLPWQLSTHTSFKVIRLALQCDNADQCMHAFYTTNDHTRDHQHVDSLAAKLCYVETACVAFTAGNIRVTDVRRLTWTTWNHVTSMMNAVWSVVDTPSLFSLLTAIWSLCIIQQDHSSAIE